MAVHYHLGKFPPDNIDWSQLIPLLGPTAAAVARYDGLLSAIPNASVLLSPLTTQEAVLSSRIEGTQATMGEVLEFEAEGEKKFSPEKRDDIQEVLNYRKAMRHAMELLQKYPLSQRVILETHKVLMDSVRGHGKSPGAYRRVPNWIGTPGCTQETARYVPISADKLPDAMGQFEKYIHDEGAADKLIQLAILHAEFEALHPFLDGNGRLGRMLIPLFLWQAGLIQQPMFYMSAYLEANRDYYYDTLLAISKEGAWTEWCFFFLKGLQAQATENGQKATQILELYNRMKIELVELTHSQYGIHALDWIFERPIFKSSDFISSAGIPKATAKRILPTLRDAGVIQIVEGARGQRSAVMSFPSLLNIAEGREVF